MIANPFGHPKTRTITDSGVKVAYCGCHVPPRPLSRLVSIRHQQYLSLQLFIKGYESQWSDIEIPDRRDAGSRFLAVSYKH